MKTILLLSDNVNNEILQNIISIKQYLISLGISLIFSNNISNIDFDYIITDSYNKINCVYNACICYKKRHPFLDKLIYLSKYKNTSCVLTSSLCDKNYLERHKLKNILFIPKTIDTKVFMPHEKTISLKKRPIFLYVGPLEKEHNIDAFLSHPFKGTTWIVGDGNDKKRLEKTYKKAVFWGEPNLEDLLWIYSNASIFVQPSKVETNTIRLKEALACGLPIAGFPSLVCMNTFSNEDLVGVMNQNLMTAIKNTLETKNSFKCREFSYQYSAEYCSQNFAKFFS